MQRRAGILTWPRATLARFVARLIFLCAAARATPPKRDMRPHQRHLLGPQCSLQAFLRAGVRHHLVDANGKLDLARIAQTCAHPEAAIADMEAAFERGLTRRNPILPRAACDALSDAPPLAAIYACDTS